MLKKYKISIIYLLLSIITVLLFSCTTSPIYPWKSSFYLSNDAASGMVIASSWLKGLIPYKDIFMNNGPLYYFIELIGYTLLNRYGIGLMEILCLFFTLLYTKKILQYYLDDFKSNIISIGILIPYIATMSGGNIAEEWILLLMILLLYIIHQESCVKNNIIIGIIIGASLMIKPIAAIALYMMWICIYIFKKENIKSILYNLIGIVIVVLPFVLYFLYHDALLLMLKGTFTMNIYLYTDDITSIIHKIIKSYPIFILFIVGLFKRKEFIGKTSIFISIGLLITTLTSHLEWYTYMPLIIIIPLLFIMINNHILINIWLYLLIVALYLTPIKNYITTMSSENRLTYETVLNDLISYKDNYQDNSLFFVNMPSYFYLETDTVPSYKYFVNQSLLCENDDSLTNEIYNEVENNMTNNIIVWKTSGWLYEEMGNYVLVDMYYQDTTVLAIYEYFEEAE